MSQLTLPFPIFTDGSIAYGSQVQADFEAIKAVLDGSVDDANLATQGITLHAKGKPGTINSSLMGAQSVVQAAMDYSSVSAGAKVVQTNGYAGANGGELIRIEKGITIAAVTTEQTFSVDWSAGDCPDGNVTFLAKPTIGTPSFLENGGYINTQIVYCKWTVRSTTGATLAVKFATNPTGGAVTLMAIAFGAKL